MNSPLILDVREDIERGIEPFRKIMQAVESLDAGQDFVLINSFEPRPLYKVLAGRGFDYEVETTEDGDWRITFFRSESQAK